MMVAFRYDNGAVGALYYSREVPSLLKGLRLSKLFGRDGIITFESNGAFVVARGQRHAPAAVPGVPGHSWLSGDVQGLLPGYKRRHATRDEPGARGRRSSTDGAGLRQPIADART